MLGIIYDEQLRKEVENKCGQLGAARNYSSMFLAVDEGILRKARRFEFVQCISLPWLVLKCDAGNMISRTKQHVCSWRRLKLMLLGIPMGDTRKVVRVGRRACVWMCCCRVNCNRW